VIVEFSRRKFLLGAGGATLALPVLEALTPSKAYAQLENAKRIIFFVTSNGSPPQNRPSGAGTGFTLGPIHQGLESHRAQVLYVGGLDGKSAQDSNGDPHATGFAATLSGRKALPGTEFKHGACFMDSNCQGTGWGGGPTLDYMIGQHDLATGAPIVHPALYFAVKNTAGSLYTRISYSAPGVPISPEASPKAAFNTLFSGVMTGMGDPMAADRAHVRRMSMLDGLKAEIVALGTKVSAADKVRLDAHLTSVRELEATLVREAGQTTGDSCTVPTPAPTLELGEVVERNAGGMEENVNDDKNDSILERHNQWQRIIVAALQCDMTRVVTFMTAPSRADTYMEWLKDDASYQGNFNYPHHERSHAGDVTTLTSMDRWYATRISSYVDNLKAMLDSTGKPLFDSTAIAWFNELGEGQAHLHNDKPHTLIGSLGGFFKTEQAVRYPNGTPHNVLLTAIAQGMGLETDHVGDAQYDGGDTSLVKA
jgi:hypothetical protein